MTLQDDIQLALKTWYPKDHKLYHDLDHPTIKLAGEAGELLDLYGKHKYKPGFDWWQCKRCSKDEICHENSISPFRMLAHDYIPLILDELGDWWYYWRIMAYILELERYPKSMSITKKTDIRDILIGMNYNSAVVLLGYKDYGEILDSYLSEAFVEFSDLLILLEVTLEEVTQLNYQKLNSEATSHGWKGA
jgi:hypothetical protein